MKTEAKKLGRPRKLGPLLKSRCFAFLPVQYEWMKRESETRKVAVSEVLRALVDQAMEAKP